MKKRIVIFASGNGTNTQNIIKFFQPSDLVEVSMVLSNNQHAKVLERAESLGIKGFSFSKKELTETNKVLEVLEKIDPDLIVLAGFLLKFPEDILEKFPNKVINIHPALLPKYGGKGMYGRHVHEAVKSNNEKESGITIHYVNKEYDEGAIIFQHSVSLDKKDSPDDIAAKVHGLEYEYFPKVIEGLLVTVDEEE